MTLLEKQKLFVQALGALIRFAGEQGYELTMGEAHVATPRKGKMEACPKCGQEITGFFHDKVHLTRGLHYSRLAADMNLFIKNEYISDGDHEAWGILGQFWESLDPLCTWGGRFSDANHFSVTHGGKK